MKCGWWSLLVLALCGCSGVRRVGKDERFVAAGEPVVRFEGRWDFTSAAHPRASWPGFAVSTVFRGRSIAARLQDYGCYYNVFVDGKLHSVVGGDPGPLVTYPLAKDLPEGSHEIRLQRRNISFDKPTVFEGFVVDRGAILAAPPEHPEKLRIEFIGDSYTAGEGNEAKAATLGWLEKYPVTNFDLTYASDLGRDLNADMTAVCRSGSGVFCDYTGIRERSMVERYDWSLIEDPAAPFNFSRQPAPDIVFISLGINDHSGLMKSPGGEVSEADSIEFRKAYRWLIAKVHQHAPQARIIAIAPPVPWARENIHRLIAEETGVKVDYIEFDRFPDGYVADGHPTVATHRKIANQLLAQLRELGIGPETKPVR